MPKVTRAADLLKVKFPLKDLLSAYDDPAKPYKEEAESEAARIYLTEKKRGKSRSLAAITASCKAGKLAEIVLRENVVGYVPVTLDGLYEHKSHPWMIKNQSAKVAVWYHDVICETEGTVEEVKHWTNKGAIDQYISDFKRSALGKYNFSDRMLVFTSDSKNLWLHKVVDFREDELDQKFVNVVLYRKGQTFTATPDLVSVMNSHPNVTIDYVIDGHTAAVTDGDWFLRNCKPSKFDDTSYVWESQL